LDLPRRLHLTSAIPSNASQKFYLCLLNGKVVEPFRSAQEYGNVLMDADPVLALETERRMLMRLAVMVVKSWLLVLLYTEETIAKTNAQT